MVTANKLDRLIMIGVAGGLQGTTIGQVLVPEIVIDRATGTRAAARADRRPHWRWADWRPASSPTDECRSPSWRRDGVAALDMETFAVGAVCEAHGVPWSVFRAISDRPGRRAGRRRGIQDGQSPTARRTSAAVARYVLPRPWKIPGLLKLGRDLNTATSAAAAAAIAAIGDT